MEERLAPPATPSRSPRTQGASRVLETPGPGDLLAWLVEGDPLGLRDLARAELDRRWLLWDADALALRTMALVAHRAGAEGRRRFTGPFLGSCMAAALEELARDPAAEGEELADLGALFGLTGPAVASACRRHNRRPELERRAFRRLAVDGVDLDRVAAELGMDASTVVRAARRALDGFLAVLASPFGGSSVLTRSDLTTGRADDR